MVGWHHRLNGHGFGLTPGVGDGQGGLVCCSTWGHKESDTNGRLENHQGIQKSYLHPPHPHQAILSSHFYLKFADIQGVQVNSTEELLKPIIWK